MKNFFRAAVLGGFFIWSAASAEPLCGRRDSFVAPLRNDFGETEVGHGVTLEGRLIELFISTKGTFTILVTTPAGVSCVAGIGQGWDSWTDPTMLSPSSPDRAP